MADTTETSITPVKKIALKNAKKKQLDLHPKMFPESAELAKYIREIRENTNVREYISILAEASKSEGYNCELCSKKLKTPYCPKCKKPSGTSSKHPKWRKKTLKEDIGERLCDRCSGTGHLSGGDCPKCQGRGRISAKTDISSTGIGSYLQKWLVKHKGDLDSLRKGAE